MLCLTLALCIATITTNSSATVAKLFDGIKPRIQSIPADRRDTLSKLAAAISNSIENRGVAKVTFICTHNSRRSQFSQAWLHVAIEHAGLGDRIEVFSGGTESTACNPRTIAALTRAGFQFDVTDTTKANPEYSSVRPDLDCSLVLFSKVYDKSPNPDSNFIAVMCCGDADERCPVVAGATDRIALHYVDPKASDGTTQETDTYDERCQQIGSEMYFTVLQVAEQLREADGPKSTN